MAPNLRKAPHVSLFIFLVGLGFKLRAWQLPSRCSTACVTLPVRFALVILEMGVSQTICPSRPQTKILLISASHEARIYIGCGYNTFYTEIYYSRAIVQQYGFLSRQK
jgi:hypothetical protein